jgi:hypothetical protein
MSNWFDEFNVVGQKAVEELREGDLFMVRDSDTKFHGDESLVLYIIEVNGVSEASRGLRNYLNVPVTVLWSWSGNLQEAQEASGQYRQGDVYYTVTRRA